MGSKRKMKKIYICILFTLFVYTLCAQSKDCFKYVSDDACYRYTAIGCQQVVNNNHAKAMNESRKIANVKAENELAKMLETAVSNAMTRMTEENGDYRDFFIDTMLVSTSKVIKGMKTICQSKTELVDNLYITNVTKEISIDNIGDMMNFEKEKDRNNFIKILKNLNK